MPMMIPDTVPVLSMGEGAGAGRFRRRYHIAGGAGQRGYTPFGTEIARTAEHNDLKEFWHIGRELSQGHLQASAMPPNIWPAEKRILETKPEKDDKPEQRGWPARYYPKEPPTVLSAILSRTGARPYSKR